MNSRTTTKPSRRTSQAYYFGCLGGAGHFLWNANGRTEYPERTELPWRLDLLDTGLLTNGKIPDVYDGQVFWTTAMDMQAKRKNAAWFAFYWWDRSVDHRGNSNSGFYVRGFDRGQHVDAWQFACDVWAETVVKRQRHPLHLQVKWSP